MLVLCCDLHLITSMLCPNDLYQANNPFNSENVILVIDREIGSKELASSFLIILFYVDHRTLLQYIDEELVARYAKPLTL